MMIISDGELSPGITASVPGLTGRPGLVALNAVWWAQERNGSAAVNAA
ncbi:MAG: hypothetical protein JXD23_05635 [Spirochaetales bacterium]|nr:hypothetical protein [Spirochaetales bacterium]